MRSSHSVLFLVLLYYEVIPAGSEINIPPENYSLSPIACLNGDLLFICISYTFSTPH